MSDIFLGHLKGGAEFCIPKSAFQTHLHLIGGTGKGKTTAIHTMLHPLLRDPRDPAAFFIIDRMGNLSWELLLWLTSKFCPESVRRRVIYIEPSREDVVMPLNPLLHETRQHGYYKVQHATDIILRAWESVNLEAMPRLARWTFNAFWAAAQLGLTVSDCAHLLMPGSDYHRPILDALPPMLKAEWKEIRKSSVEAGRILESSRNRLKPYFEAPILQNMFGSTKSLLDVHRFMQEGRIVLLNLAPRNRLSPQLGDAIGALVINEILATARSLPLGIRYPTYMLLDEFQNFVGPDLESALPEVRQLGIRLILSHQSFSQLEKGDYDLTSMIFQAQSRIAFGVQGEDAEILGHEFGSVTYNPKRIKDTLYSTRQKLVGHEKIILRSWGESATEAENWNKAYGEGWTENNGKSKRDGSHLQTHNHGNAHVRNEQKGEGGGCSHALTNGQAEHLVPIHRDVQELASKTFYTGDEWDRVWAKRARVLPTGTALIRLVDDARLYKVAVERSAVGYLGWETPLLMRRLPQIIENVHEFIEENFRSDLFVTPAEIERETKKRLDELLRRPVNLRSASANLNAPEGQKIPFSD